MLLNRPFQPKLPLMPIRFAAAPISAGRRSRLSAAFALLLTAGLATTLLTSSPGALLGDDPSPETPAAPAMITHSVFFTLNESTDAGRAALTAACDKYLTDHEGVVFYAAGPRGEAFDRDVNDQTFDVALLVVFESKEAHDKYQVAPRHEQFIEENKATWKTVRVFDAVVAGK
ncbi:MAG: Dabb family protein [Planctomycetota bacterium]